VVGLGDVRRKETKLTGGAHASAREERESVEHRGRKPKRKTYFVRTPRACRPDGPAEWGDGLRARRAGSARLSWAGSQEKIQANFGFLNFKNFRNLIELGEILQGDLE
jgi:hypothetical protein